MERGFSASIIARGSIAQMLSVTPQLRVYAGEAHSLIAVAAGERIGRGAAAFAA
jgi:hypothetical protein